MKFIATIGSAVVLLNLAGCATQPENQFKLQTQSLELINFPELNKVETIEVGESLVSKKYVSTQNVISIGENIDQEDLQIPIGKLFKVGTSPLGSLYESENFKWVGRTNIFFKTTISAVGGLIVDESNMMATHIYNDMLGNAYKNTKSKRPEDINYPLSKWELKQPLKVKIESPKIIENKNGYTRDLIYSGISNNTISITYKEFLGDFARPAFTENLKFDLNESNLIGYKGSRFEVIKATNTELRYKVLKHLN